MSDALEKTAAGATRGLLGSYSFILVLLGLEMWTGQHGTQIGLGLFFLILGGLLAYAAFFWETAKKVLSAEAQAALGRFAQSRSTWAFVLFLVFQALLFAPFIEQHRWPFSYPTDPETINQLNKARNDLNSEKGKFGPEKELADRWRFVRQMRTANSSRTNCRYQLVMTPRAQSTSVFWDELLQNAGWVGDGAAPQNQAVIQPGITLRVADGSTNCASFLQRALSDFYPNPPARIATGQQNSCGKDCVIIEIDY